MGGGAHKWDKNFIADQGEQSWSIKFFEKKFKSNSTPNDFVIFHGVDIHNSNFYLRWVFSSLATSAYKFCTKFIPSCAIGNNNWFSGQRQLFQGRLLLLLLLCPPAVVNTAGWQIPVGQIRFRSKVEFWTSARVALSTKSEQWITRTRTRMELPGLQCNSSC